MCIRDSDYSEEEATKILSEPAVTAIADIKMGAAQATAWGCDLTYDLSLIHIWNLSLERIRSAGMCSADFYTQPEFLCL